MHDLVVLPRGALPRADLLRDAILRAALPRSALPGRTATATAALHVEVLEEYYFSHVDHLGAHDQDACDAEEYLVLEEVTRGRT